MTEKSDCVVAIGLRRADGAPLPGWEPGAHIDVLLPNGSLRQYSLCGDRDDEDEWRIALHGGATGRTRASYPSDALKPGSRVHARAPRNNFPLVPAPEYVFIAGGIGISPILAMVHSVAAQGLPWRLVYLGRSRQSMAFIDEIRVLGGDIQIHAEDEHGPFPLADLLANLSDDCHLYTCGPRRLLAAVQRLTETWSDPSRSHAERFVVDAR